MKHTSTELSGKPVKNLLMEPSISIVCSGWFIRADQRGVADVCCVSRTDAHSAIFLDIGPGEVWKRVTEVEGWTNELVRNDQLARRLIKSNEFFFEEFSGEVRLARRPDCIITSIGRQVDK